MTGDLRTPRPRDVAGFAAAQAAGRTPARPATRPRLAPGITARNALRRLAFVGSGAVAAALVTLLVLPKDEGSLPPDTLVAFLLVTIAGVVVTWRVMVGFRGVLLRELQAGYVTTTFEQGGFWLGQAGKQSRGIVPWDWRGLWVLDKHGEVRSSPQADADPPGSYPSAQQPGRSELWTGCRWTRFYTD